VTVRAAEELTGIASWFDGRIKTLHPGLLGGILAIFWKPPAQPVLTVEARPVPPPPS
jgi:AICAR transformylase/IMP cyclohydrolase PurH